MTALRFGDAVPVIDDHSLSYLTDETVQTELVYA
jgi:hypothetical protein